MTFAQLWPPLLILGIGLLLNLVALVIHVKLGDEDGPDWVAIFVGIVGLVLLFNSADTLIKLLNHHG